MAHELKAQYAIFRTSWVYGEGGNFIRTILRLAKERQTLKVIADQYGVPSSARWLAEVSLALTLDENNQLRQFPSGIYHAVPSGETTWHALACYAVQAALDAGAALQLHPDAIEAIPATEYPLPAPRPMNSRMARGALEAALLIRKAARPMCQNCSYCSSLGSRRSQRMSRTWCTVKLI
jgi:dTDP-4-dehydrorhamnose reductase